MFGVKEGKGKDKTLETPPLKHGQLFNNLPPRTLLLLLIHVHSYRIISYAFFLSLFFENGWPKLKGTQSLGT